MMWELELEGRTGHAGELKHGDIHSGEAIQACVVDCCIERARGGA